MIARCLCCREWFSKEPGLIVFISRSMEKSRNGGLFKKDTRPRRDAQVMTESVWRWRLARRAAKCPDVGSRTSDVGRRTSDVGGRTSEDGRRRTDARRQTSNIRKEMTEDGARGKKARGQKRKKRRVGAQRRSDEAQREEKTRLSGAGGFRGVPEKHRTDIIQKSRGTEKRLEAKCGDTDQPKSSPIVRANSSRSVIFSWLTLKTASRSSLPYSCTMRLRNPTARIIFSVISCPIWPCSSRR